MLFLRYYIIKFIMVQKWVGKSNLQNMSKLSCINKIILELFLDRKLLKGNKVSICPNFVLVNINWRFSLFLL